MSSSRYNKIKERLALADKINSNPYYIEIVTYSYYKKQKLKYIIFKDFI
jgi:hypothetical protein